MNPTFPALLSLTAVALLAACGGDTAADSAGAAVPDPVQLTVRMTNTAASAQQTSTGSTYEVLFAPGILILHDETFALYEPGMPILFPAFESLAEDGDNAPLVDQLEGLPGVVLVRSYAALDEDYNNAPMLPGDDAVLTEMVPFGTRLTVAAMYGESNDVFVATPPEGVPLWNDDETPATGSLTQQLAFWDAGTEVNEEPGLGDNQPARQLTKDSGPDENGVVVEVKLVDASNFDYPDAPNVLSIDVEVPE